MMEIPWNSMSHHREIDMWQTNVFLRSKMVFEMNWSMIENFPIELHVEQIQMLFPNSINPDQSKMELNLTNIQFQLFISIQWRIPLIWQSFIISVWRWGEFGRIEQICCRVQMLMDSFSTLQWRRQENFFLSLKLKCKVK